MASHKEDDRNRESGGQRGSGSNQPGQGGYGTTGNTYGGGMTGAGMRGGIGMGGRGGSQGGTLTWDGPHTGRGPQGYQRSAESIREEICERLTRHGQVDARGIRVTVENGEVTLEGTVKTRREKRLAEDILENISGLRDIHNRLRIDQPQGVQGSAGTPGASRDD